MGKLYKKNELDFDNLLLECSFIMKGKAQEVHVYTTSSEIMDFMDWMNNNPNYDGSYSKIGKDNFGNKYYTFNDYKKRASVTISISDCKVFQIPWFFDKGEFLEASTLQYRSK